MRNFQHLLKNLDKVLLVLPIFFAVLSILMIASTAYQGSFFLSKDVKVQAIAYCLGWICLFGLLQIDYKFYQNFEKPLYIGSLLFLLSVYIPGLGLTQFGARSWINLRFITMQPSEFVKITFVILLAMYLARNRENLQTVKGIAQAFLYAFPFIAIILKEDLGTATVMCAIWIIMIFFAGISYKWFGVGAGIFAVLMPIFYMVMADHQKARIEAWLHQGNLTLDAAYQVWQSKVAIGSGGFFGKGLFKGTQKSLNFIPVQKSDFIFSVIGEELGALGGIIVISLYTLFFYRIAKIAEGALDLYGALICIGFLGMFGFQTFENIAMTMGLMPVTGITLPMISYGGSSILSSMMCIGIILGVGMRSKSITF